MATTSGLSPRARRWTAILLCGLAIGLHLYQIDWLRHLPRPAGCDGQAPGWLPGLIELSRDLGLPGFQLAVRTRQGERINCAAGWSHVLPWPERLNPQHRMRYASLSKIFTSVVAVQLMDEGLPPSHTAASLLIPGVEPADPRILQITLAQLLTHTGGMDRHKSGDPMADTAPWCPSDLTQFSRLKLDQAPGEAYAYSNLGYCLIGAAIARHEGSSLEAVFEQRLFQPAAARGLRALKRNSVLDDESGANFTAPETSQMLQDFAYESMLASGAWSGTASAFMDVLIAATSPAGPLLTPAQRSILLTPPTPCDSARWRRCHGYGFYTYRRTPAPTMYWHDGSLPGVTAFAGVLDDGSAVVLLANGRNPDWMRDNDRLGLALYQWMQEEP